MGTKRCDSSWMSFLLEGLKATRNSSGQKNDKKSVSDTWYRVSPLLDMNKIIARGSTNYLVRLGITISFVALGVKFRIKSNQDFPVSLCRVVKKRRETRSKIIVHHAGDTHRQRETLRHHNGDPSYPYTINTQLQKK